MPTTVRPPGTIVAAPERSDDLGAPLVLPGVASISADGSTDDLANTCEYTLTLPAAQLSVAVSSDASSDGIIRPSRSP